MVTATEAYLTPLMRAEMMVPAGTFAPSSVTVPQKLEGMGGVANTVETLTSRRAMVSISAVKIR